MSLTQRLNEEHKHPGDWFAKAWAIIILGGLASMSPYTHKAIEAVRAWQNREVAKQEVRYTDQTTENAYNGSANLQELTGAQSRHFYSKGEAREIK